MLLMAACGGRGDKAPPTTGTVTHSEAGSAEAPPEKPKLKGRDSTRWPSEMKAFFEVVAPRFHSEVGAQRMADTCGAMADMRAAADRVAASPPPVPANAGTWTSAGPALVAATTEIVSTCAAHDLESFNAAFEAVVRAFHALMEATVPPGEE